MQDKTWYSILGLDTELLFLQDDMLSEEITDLFRILLAVITGFISYNSSKSTSKKGLSPTDKRTFFCTYLGIEYQEGLRIEDVVQPNMLVPLLPRGATGVACAL